MIGIARLSNASPSLESLRNPTVCDELVRLLREAGVTRAFGLSGGAIARFMGALSRGGIDVVHCRHEGGAAFIATEYSLASREPVVVFTTTGPGLTNALTGCCAAEAEGADVILVCGATAVDRRGRYAFQETSPGAWLDIAAHPFEDIVIDEPDDLEWAARSLRSRRASARGRVARIFLSASAQMLPAERRESTPTTGRVRPAPTELIAECADRLDRGRTVIWAGFGARDASASIRQLAEKRSWPVMVTPRGKGIFDERHPLYLGVTGLGGHGRVLGYLSENEPDHVLVLGTRLSEFSSFWSPVFEPRQAFVHVDVDAKVFGRAYPHVPTIGVRVDADFFASELAERMRPALAAAPVFTSVKDSLPPASGEGLHPADVMAAVQRVVVEGSDAIVMTEAGNAFAWGSRALCFEKPNRYRTSMAFGAMGQSTAGVVGAALAAKDKAVALVGDGAMLMNHEVSTAVQYGANAVWVVLNDAKYGMVEHGMRAIGMEPIETRIPRADFAAIARAVGAVGLSATSEEELEVALWRAMRTPGPVVVDVLVDGGPPPPFAGRNRSIRAQERKESGAWVMQD